MVLENINWEFWGIVLAIIIFIVILIFYVSFGKSISTDSCYIINNMVDMFSLGSGLFRIGLPHVCGVS